MYTRISKIKEEKSYIEQLLVKAKKDYDALNEVCINLRCQVDARKGDKKVRFSDTDDVKFISPTKDSKLTGYAKDKSNKNKEQHDHSKAKAHDKEYSKSFYMVGEDIRTEVSLSLNETNIERINNLTKELVR